MKTSKTPKTKTKTTAKATQNHTLVPTTFTSRDCINWLDAKCSSTEELLFGVLAYTPIFNDEDAVEEIDDFVWRKYNNHNRDVDEVCIDLPFARYDTRPKRNKEMDPEVATCQLACLWLLDPHRNANEIIPDNSYADVGDEYIADHDIPFSFTLSSKFREAVERAAQESLIEHYRTSFARVAAWLKETNNENVVVRLAQHCAVMYKMSPYADQP